MVGIIGIATSNPINAQKKETTEKQDGLGFEKIKPRLEGPGAVKTEMVKTLERFVKLARDYGEVKVAFGTVYSPTSKPDKDEIKRVTFSIKNGKHDGYCVERLLRGICNEIKKRKVCDVEKKSEENLHVFVFDDIGELSKEVKDDIRKLADVEKTTDAEEGPANS
jgi:undecaprenyl pyrophosphate synthase